MREGPLGTIALLTYGGSPFLREVVTRIQREAEWYRLVIWSGDPEEVPAWEGVHVHSIPPRMFDHGATRNLAMDLARGEFLVFLSDDATPVGDGWSTNLLQAIKPPSISVAFGRQIAREEADLGERLFRAFSYPDRPMTGGVQEVRNRSFPVSNAHAIYRITALRDAGGFPAPCAFGEDRIVSARLAAKGWAIAYCDNAIVYHSHEESLVNRLRRGLNAARAKVDWSWPRGTIRGMVRQAWTLHGIRGVSSLAIALVPRWAGYQLGRLGRQRETGLVDEQ